MQQTAKRVVNFGICRRLRLKKPINSLKPTYVTPKQANPLLYPYVFQAFLQSLEKCLHITR